jgi:phosphopantetheinyl transferase
VLADFFATWRAKFTNSMAIIQKETAAGRAWALWKIEEEEDELLARATGLEAIPEKLKHPNRRLEFVAGRVLIGELMEQLGQPYQGVTSNEHGKPVLINSSCQVSITHSFPYVAALVDAGKPAGIDLEQVSHRLIKMAPRIFHISELRDAGRHPVKHTIIWSGKETLMKIYGKRDVVFSEHLRIDPFRINPEGGELMGHILVEGAEADVPLSYRLIDDFVLVFTR